MRIEDPIFCGIRGVRWEETYFSPEYLKVWSKEVYVFTNSGEVTVYHYQNGNMRKPVSKVKFEDYVGVGLLFSKIDELAIKKGMNVMLIDDCDGKTTVVYDDCREIIIPRGTGSEDGSIHSIIAEWMNQHKFEAN